MELRLDEIAVARLSSWKGAVVQWVSSEWPDLTNRQLALLMIVCIEPDRHLVCDLAERLDVSTPIVSRVLDRLVDLDLVKREAGKRDRRQVYILPTRLGFDFLSAIDRFLTTDARVNHLPAT